ncbi:hypothetical protein [uncultured Jatrophihabitans sp.]|uniref:hypothetical protein n=1 Tax=uncultured Jatrophihabitans sp. TaxID=1610747 RepID=UPI0035C94F9B
MVNTDRVGPSALEREAVKLLLQAVMEQHVRHGDLVLNGRSDEDVADQVAEILKCYVDQLGEFEVVKDHRATLFEEARVYLAAGKADLALMLIATWIEHWLNDMIAWRAESTGLNDSEIIQLLRDSGFRSKLTVTWRLVFAERLPDRLVGIAQRVGERRNAFVHYKWQSKPAGDAAADDERTAALASDSLAAVQEFLAIEERLVFANDRDRFLRILDEVGE